MPVNKKVSDEILLESYSRLRNIWKVAEEVGLCGQSVQERLVKLGVKRNNPQFTDKEVEHLKSHYTQYLLNGELQKLADEMGRTKPFICRKAKLLGLTDLRRKRSLLANYKPPKPDWVKNKHPRGMAGKKHTQATLDKVSLASIASQAKINADPDRRAEISKKQVETKMKRGNLVRERHKTTWKGGWRLIGSLNKYYRSRWEANYARYLQWLKERGEITEWAHESKVFWFEGIKRGCVSFLPDFEITNNDGSIVYHEVKGWMDDRSKTKIKRMAIYFPEVSLTIIDAKWFKANEKELSKIIDGWEFKTT